MRLNFEHKKTALRVVQALIAKLRGCFHFPTRRSYTNDITISICTGTKNAANVRLSAAIKFERCKVGECFWDMQVLMKKSLMCFITFFLWL